MVTLFEKLSIHCSEILFSVVKIGGDEIDDCKKWRGHVLSVYGVNDAYAVIACQSA